MGSRKRTGPAIVATIGGARKIGRRYEGLPDQFDTATSTDLQARRTTDDLIANGAELHYRAGEFGLPASFIYELRPGGDRQECRRLIAEAKADPHVWAAMLREIARESLYDARQ